MPHSDAAHDGDRSHVVHVRQCDDPRDVGWSTLLRTDASLARAVKGPPTKRMTSTSLFITATGPASIKPKGRRESRSVTKAGPLTGTWCPELARCRRSRVLELPQTPGVHGYRRGPTRCPTRSLAGATGIPYPSRWSRSLEGTRPQVPVDLAVLAAASRRVARTWLLPRTERQRRQDRMKRSPARGAICRSRVVRGSVVSHGDCLAGLASSPVEALLSHPGAAHRPKRTRNQPWGTTPSPTATGVDPAQQRLPEPRVRRGRVGQGKLDAVEQSGGSEG